MKRTHSELWLKAVKYSKRKYTCSKPVSLSNDGLLVTMQSLIRGNTWQYNLNEINILLRKA
jgi:hypothetical protein